MQWCIIYPRVYYEGMKGFSMCENRNKTKHFVENIILVLGETRGRGMVVTYF